MIHYSQQSGHESFLDNKKEKSMYEQKTYPGNHPRINVTADFVEKSRFRLNRKPEEIIAKIGECSGMFSFSTEVLIHYLSFEDGKKLFSTDYVKSVESGETKHVQITDVMEATQDFLDYMVFGWSKALDERGISASRTVGKIGAWLWLLGRDDLEAIVTDDDNYNPYGMPALIEVCEDLGIVVPSECHKFADKKC